MKQRVVKKEVKKRNSKALKNTKNKFKKKKCEKKF